MPSGLLARLNGEYDFFRCTVTTSGILDTGIDSVVFCAISLSCFLRSLASFISFLKAPLTSRQLPLDSQDITFPRVSRSASSAILKLLRTITYECRDFLNAKLEENMSSEIALKIKKFISKYSTLMSIHQHMICSRNLNHFTVYFNLLKHFLSFESNVSYFERF